MCYFQCTVSLCVQFDVESLRVRHLRLNVVAEAVCVYIGPTSVASN